MDTISNIVNNRKSSYPVNADFKPDIIFVMSEAFWDPVSPYVMQGLTIIKSEPLPSY